MTDLLGASQKKKMLLPASAQVERRHRFSGGKKIVVFTENVDLGRGAKVLITLHLLQDIFVRFHSRILYLQNLVLKKQKAFS